MRGDEAMKPHTAAEALAWMAANPGKVLVGPDRKYRMTEWVGQSLFLQFCQGDEWLDTPRLPLGEYREEEVKLDTDALSANAEEKIALALGRECFNVTRKGFFDGVAIMDAFKQYRQCILAEVRRMVESHKAARAVEGGR